MKKVKFKDIGLYSGFLQDFGEEFKYLHVDYLGEDIGLSLWLTTETFSDYFFDCDIENFYEIGLYSMEEYDSNSLRSILGDGLFRRFYEVDYE